MKNNTIKIIIALIFLVLFNILYFVLGGINQSAVHWLSYGFIHVSYLLLLSTPLLCPHCDGQTVLIASLYLRALQYFFTELVVGIAIILLGLQDIALPLIVQSVLLALFLILQLMGVLANRATSKSLDHQRVGSQLISGLTQQVRQAMREINDPKIKGKVETCYNALLACSVESIEQAKEAEDNLKDAVHDLCVAVDAADNDSIEKCAKKVTSAIQRRNAILMQNRN